MGLFDPKWKSRNFDKAFKAARAVTDNDQLKTIALEAFDDKIRTDAANRITSQKILKELAINGNQFVSSAAISRIDDDRYLKELAVGGSAQAMDRIRDPDVLAEIVASAAPISIIEKAVDMIADSESLIAAFFRTDRNEVKRTIWKKLPLDAAMLIATKENYPMEDTCEKMGAHCSAPGPRSHFIEQNFEEGFYEHELICCRLCGKPLWHRSKHTAVWDKDWSGGYIDFQKYSDWELSQGEWKAKVKDQYGAWIVIPTKDRDGCYEE